MVIVAFNDMSMTREVRCYCFRVRVFSDAVGNWGASSLMRSVIGVEESNDIPEIQNGIEGYNGGSVVV